MVLLAQLMMMVSSSAQHTSETMPRRLLLFLPDLFLLLSFWLILELLSGKKVRKHRGPGFRFFESISQMWGVYKDEGGIFDEISVNFTLLCPVSMIYYLMNATNF